MAQSNKMTESDRLWEEIRRLTQKPESNISALIGEYVLYHLHDYEQPTRAGTSKGEKIGFSRKKYYAAMLAGITNWTLKDIAKSCDVSYGLLRKWRTDPEFYESSYAHAIEFASEIIKRTKTTLPAWNPYEIDPGIPSDDYQKMLFEANHYSEAVFFLLLRFVITLQRKLEKVDGDEFDKKSALAILLFNMLKYRETREMIVTPPIFARKRVGAIRDIVESKRTFSSEEHRQVLDDLSFIENALDAYQSEFERTYTEKQQKLKTDKKLEKFLSKSPVSVDLYKLLDKEPS